MAEYIALTQNVPINQPVVFDASIPCNRGLVIHDDGTGIFILRGVVNNQNACFTRYAITFNGNIAIPEGSAEIGAIAISLAVNGESRPSSKAIVTPAAVNEFFNVTSTAIVTIPRGCCFSVSVRAVPASDDPTVTPVPILTVSNGNLEITRVA